jgi:hypothetical protein
MTFKREYTYSWIVVGLTALFGVLTGLKLLVDMAFVIGLLVEAGAVIRPKKGDTLSEHTAFYVRSQPAGPAIVFVMGVGIALAFIQFGTGAFPAVRVLLGTVFVAWFTGHILLFNLTRSGE